ncbi:TPM domain-containing protein [Ramlibacter sp.]|uniref:TPM domain-containing protein n=1 Tax=Ramlibacter sp. TaxID=1917967 RepID=UPI002626BBE6|nr:TPM domain-containing protein [Ramlibacter sp.]MDB5954255.1 hypothetical protein [Ramlibacter sp.]
MRRLFAFAVAALWCLLAAAQAVLPIPALTARVIDQTDTLDAVQIKGLDDKLAAFEQKKGTQIAILLVPTTQPEDIASYANRVGNAWKIGRKQVGDGILVVVAKNDRKVRIEVAKTLEGAVPDLAASRIIDETITPRFRQGDFAGGLQAGVDQLIARISGEPLPAPAQAAPAQNQPPGKPGFDWFNLAILLFIAVPIAGRVLRGMLGSKLGSLVTGAGVGVIAMLVTSSLVVAAIAAIVALLFALLSGGGPLGGGRRGFGGPVIFPGGWGGGGGGFGGGGGGGGFRSGGGGDFGGGGASGGW